jgi:copper(I)-binding protein
MTRRAATRVSRLTAALAVGLALCLSACGGSGQSAQATKAPSFAAASSHDLRLTGGWVSATGAMGDMAGMDMSSGAMSGTAEATAYATLTNTGTRPDALVSVSTPAASTVTLHDTRTTADGSAGTMVGVATIALPPKGHVTLAPGGYHVMLEGLTSDLETGTTIPMTWTFRSGATLTTRFPVIDPADRPQSDQ